MFFCVKITSFTLTAHSYLRYLHGKTLLWHLHAGSAKDSHILYLLFYCIT